MDCQIRKFIFIRYYGHETDKYINRLNDSGALIKPILTLRKLKTLMPALKTKDPNELESNLVYEYKCSRCQSTYVGKTIRHLKVRVQEHKLHRKEAINKHYHMCKETITFDRYKII